ncbi:SAM-dependent DNA methyltransferase [Polynucleobacter paneuropaeus]|uniref:SAM-dependent DNA methyltransferase n=1 Tax=Polynucleobacter paneuropaeus TaxID=2527775 RepID=A0A2Z4JVA4_9BURK|nr:SAM-dependent DNA methyltransferase [Polynucleobacter paneuropaeus]AWW50569.1 SAM-dependent DNA methyltransferase [Polynucleobacter paneuropaeus]
MSNQLKQEPLDSQVVSRNRVTNHGEVYTNPREVNAMLDLVKHETERIDSRFLESACGHGNFLIEILTRKLATVESRYKKSQTEFECYSIIAVSSLYGIDILEDNVVDCRKRLLNKFIEFYDKSYKSNKREECINSIEFILSKNIVWGDALTFQTASNPPKPIVFSEWSPATEGFVKRRDYSFEGLLIHAEIESLPLFSDMGDGVFIPTPVKDYPLTSYFGVTNER